MSSMTKHERLRFEAMLAAIYDWALANGGAMPGRMYLGWDQWYAVCQLDLDDRRLNRHGGPRPALYDIPILRVNEQDHFYLAKEKPCP